MCVIILTRRLIIIITTMKRRDIFDNENNRIKEFLDKEIRGKL